MQIQILAERPDDIPAIFILNKLAFGQDEESKLVDIIRKGKNFIPELSMVALFNNTIVGHILFSKIQIVGKDMRHESLALAPMAVLPGFQKKGIGSKLVMNGLEAAAGLGFKSVIVLGHKDYYPKFGFQPAENWKIFPPFEVPAEVFMAIELEPKGLENISGTVEYPEEFTLVS